MTNPTQEDLVERTIDELMLAQEAESLARTNYFFVATETGLALEWWREVRKSKGHTPDEKAVAWGLSLIHISEPTRPY